MSDLKKHAVITMGVPKDWNPYEQLVEDFPWPNLTFLFDSYGEAMAFISVCEEKCCYLDLDGTDNLAFYPVVP